MMHFQATERLQSFNYNRIILVSKRGKQEQISLRTAFLTASRLTGPPRVRSTHVRQGTPMSGAHSVRHLPGAPWAKIEDMKDI